MAAAVVAAAIAVSWPSRAAADPGGAEREVVIGLGGPAGEPDPLVVPDPLVIGRDRPAPARFRLDPAASGAADAFEIAFDGGSPFVQAEARGPASTPLTLGPLRAPIELGRFEYEVRLLDAAGAVVMTARSAVEVREWAGLEPRAYIAAGVVALLLLLVNYLDPKPLTRSYEDGH